MYLRTRASVDSGLDLKGIRTLVVDDDPGVRAVLRRTLSEWGAQVRELDAGPQAIVELKRARDGGKPYQLIFLDSTMSPIDGFEVLGRIRDRREEFERTILTVGPEKITEEVPRARDFGVTYVAKPLTRPALIGAIVGVLNLKVAPSEPSAATSRDSGSLSRFRVLLAEDSPDVGAIFRHYLEGAEYQVDVARDGGVAVDLFRMGAYDLILMDIQMPNFDGYWATREIREWEKNHQMKRTPIIAVTAFPQQEDPQKSFRAGLDGYLVKPVNKDALVKTIRRHLGNRAATR